jgi:subtilisin family serine protease
MQISSSRNPLRARWGCWAALCASAVLTACGGGSQDDPSSGGAAAGPQGTALSRLALPKDKITAQRVDRRLANAQGPVDVWVSFDEPSMAAWQAQRAAALGLEAGVLHREAKAAKADAVAGKPRAETAEFAALKTLRSEMAGQRNKLEQQHTSFKAVIGSLGAEELGRVRVAHNAIALRLDAKHLGALAAQSGVIKVRPVVHYKLNLAETVPYVGGTALQSRGLDGTGMTIAIIDSGIDYTHRNLGGPGTVGAYAEAAGANADDPKSGLPNALFPNSKVVGGFDFTGDKWPAGERTEDPNPIDYWFHGTHVADIAGGTKGMAPGAKLLAVKACSSVSGQCNGIALLKAIDFSLDPNGDGNTDDAADVINLSLGNIFGQPEDELSFASGNAVDMGVVVVAAAGNGGEVATVVDAPSTEPGVISVAQTQVPSAKAGIFNITAPASIARSITNLSNAAAVSTPTAISGDVVFLGRGCPASSSAAEDPYLSNPAGKVALIDLGGCPVAAKVDRAARAGAKAVLFGVLTITELLPPRDVGSGLVLSALIPMTESNAIKAELAAGTTVTVSLEVKALEKSVVGTSSRGPSNQTVRIKPEISAPGESVSAVVGSGAQEAPFSGTSGATPMVAGAAAQLLQAFPNRTPMQIKAMLMNTAFTDIQSDPVSQPGVLAPIARIGAGEMRADRAAASQLIAFNPAQKSAALSFGFQAVSNLGVLTQSLRLHNFSDVPKQVRLTPRFRYENDRASGAVLIRVPADVVVPANGGITVTVLMSINASRLPAWTQDGADLPAAGRTLSANEYDGYISIDDGSAPITVPWHVIPRKASALVVNSSGTTQTPIALSNRGAQEAVAEVFALTGESTRVPAGELPQPGSNRSFTDLRAAGARLLEPGVVQFGIATFGRRSNTLRPSGYEVQVDVNRDGTPEYVLFNGELEGLVVVYVLDIATGLSTPYYLVEADLFSGNMIFTAPLDVMGLTDSSTFNFTVVALDNYFTGQASDTIGPMTFTPDKPKFRVEGGTVVTVPRNRTVLLNTSAVAGGDTASPSQTGLLLMQRGNAGTESVPVQLSR